MCAYDDARSSLVEAAVGRVESVFFMFRFSTFHRNVSTVLCMLAYLSAK